MSIKSILAAYVGNAAGASGMKLAVHMARKYDAYLTGVVWHGPSPVASRYGRYMTAEVLEILDARDNEVIADIRADFMARTEAAKLGERSEFMDIGSRSDFSLAECARSFDVIVMGLGGAETGQEHFAVRPDVIALRSGRPVILVPRDYEVEALGDHALVAWDGKRAAARALGDAMHILETKKKVTVLTVGDAVPESNAADVKKLLTRHGVENEHIVRPVGKGGVGRTILSTCRDVGAGLLIMGAYEHSKFSEDLLGGVTQDILSHADLPVLMSH